MRPHQHRRLAQERIGAPPQSLDPAANKRHFDLGACDEHRRPGEQHEGPRVGQSDHLAERLARLARLASEPAIEQLRSGDSDPLRRHTVIIDRFLLLMLVPHRDHVGRKTHVAFVGQVVPARDRSDERHACGLRGTGHVHLIGRRIDER
jgi:hypothetical protein